MWVEHLVSATHLRTRCTTPSVRVSLCNTSAHALYHTLCECCRSEEVVQVYGICIRTLHLPVISVMILGVMRLSYNERAVSEGRFRHHLFQAVFVRTSYPSRYVYFRWSRVHKAVETAVTATVVMLERCKSRVQLEASEISEIQAPVAHERRLL